MNVQVVVGHRLLHLGTQQVVIHEGFGRLAGEFHHHASRCVGIHVGILTGHIVRLDIDDLQENVTCLRLAGDAALVAVGDVFLCHILAATLHQLHLHGILNRLHRHLRVASESDMIGDLADQLFVLPLIGMEHRLTDCGDNLILVEAHDAAISFDYGLYHFYCCKFDYLDDAKIACRPISYPFWKTFSRLKNVKSFVINLLKNILENFVLCIVFKLFDTRGREVAV